VRGSILHHTHTSIMDEIRIQLITYNVGTWAPVAGKTDISAILPSAGPTPDFVFVGFQEVNTSPTALVSDTVLSPTGEDEWTSHTRQALAQKGLIKIRSIRLLGIVLSMFCLEKHIPHLRGIETQYTRLERILGQQGSGVCEISGVRRVCVCS